MDEMHLILFHIGPVQEFIVSARRSRDLWFGSWVLSELSKAAALELVRQNGNDISCLIFPAPVDISQLQCEKFNVANRVIGLTAQQPDKLGERVRKVVLGRLQEIRNEAFSKNVISGEFDRSVAEKQVDDLLELFWVSCPVGENYSKARDRAEALMAARKATRNYEPVQWGSSEENSSLDGLRESVIPKKAYSMKENRLRKEYGVRPGERLCGVGLMKRHGRRGEGDRFLSTSHVAALPLLETLSEQKRGAVNVYFQTLKELEIQSDALNTVPRFHPVFGYNDGHLLFPERLREFFDDEKTLEKAVQAVENLLCQAFGGQRPAPYYALLSADGDHMGKVISQQKTFEQHRAFSQCLSNFAQQVDSLIDKHKGSLVYAGGDDVLAFVPLHTALKCARELANVFKEQLAGFPLEEGGTPTLSVGLVIAHHLEPLSTVLELARTTESEAKLVEGKNALAVTLSKRSGSEQTVKGTWGSLDARLEWFIQLYLQENIPYGLAYELRGLALELEDMENVNRIEKIPKEAFKSVINAEVKRILKRKKAGSEARPIDEETINGLVEFLNEKQVTVRQLADELIIAGEFAVAIRMARISPVSTLTGEGDE